MPNKNCNLRTGRALIHEDMTTNQKEDGAGFDPDRDEVLWTLLGRGRPTEVSPFFARRVLRDLQADAAPNRWWAWLRPGRVVVGGFAVAVMSIGVFSLLPPRGAVRTEPMTAAVRPLSPVPAVATAFPPAAVAAADDVTPQDIEVIADLDNTVAREETNVWTDETSRF